MRIKQLGDDVTAKNIKPLITTIYYIVGIVKVKQIGDETKINAAEQVKISNYTKKNELLKLMTFVTLSQICLIFTIL